MLQRKPAGHITEVRVNQTTQEKVTATWSDGHVDSDECSTGKGHCCFDATTGVAEGGACSASRSNEIGNNCTPVGTFSVTAKIPKTSAGIEFWTQFHDGKSVALHDYDPFVDGTPLSHGCVRLHRDFAKTIFDGARVGVTRVVVENLARPSCNHADLVTEWEGDVRDAGKKPPDGTQINPDTKKLFTRAEIASEKRHINETREELRSAFGVDDAGLDKQLASVVTSKDVQALIPRCVPAQTVEEKGLPAAEKAGQAGDAAKTGAALEQALRRARDTRAAAAAVKAAAASLAAAAAAKAEDFTVEDDVTHWTRIALSSVIRRYNPTWAKNADEVRRLQEELLRAPRELEQRGDRRPDDHGGNQAVSAVMTATSVASKASVAPAPQLVQRRCECGGVPGPDGECAACKARRLGLQRSAASPDPGAVGGHVPGNSAGRPLDAATRTTMETAFGRDFGGVRVHTDVSGGRAAEALGAHAYTVGSDIYFAAGRYAPRGPAGARLLAHELAHTIHQQGAAQVQAAHAIDPPGSPLEVEADRAAQDAVAGRRALVRGRVSHHVPQRQAAGGERRTRTIPGGHVDVTRRLEPQPCSRVPDTQPRGEVYLDRNAEAFGVRFGFCRGNTDVDFDSALRYGNLLQQARDLAQSVPQTALAGGDPLGAIETAVRAGTITGQASVTATVSGVLVAQVSGSTTQGLQERSYEVSGLLRINPGGSWALELSAEYQHIVSDLGGTTTRLRFTPRADFGAVQLGVGVERTETQPAGGGPSTGPTTAVSGTASIPFGRSGVGINITGSSEGGGTFSITFGTVERREAIPRVRSVECYACECPPPLPRYTCTRVIDPHPGEPRETQAAGHQVVRLHYRYDNSDPANPTEYGEQVRSIAGLVGQNYTVQSITGYASPEASNPSHNVALSQRRADARGGDRGRARRSSGDDASHGGGRRRALRTARPRGDPRRRG